MRIFRTILAAMLAALLAAASAIADSRLPGPRGMTGPQGPQGARGNAVLSGPSAPDNTIGINGDFYVDTTAQLLYGPKAEGTWPGGPRVFTLGAPPLSGAAGGTGWANTGFTIKLGGNLMFSGAHNVAFTVAGDTTLVLPTSGTLLTTGGDGSALSGITASQISGLAPSATTDATNASNVTSGTLPAGRLPTPGASTLGGIKASTAAAGQFANGIDGGGNVTYATPSGSGTVNSGNAGDIAGYSASGAAVSGVGSVSALVPTGAAMPYLGTSAPTGWVLGAGTIGDASSGATSRANADTQALYTLVWTSLSNTEAPVAGGRGANAAADFGAHKAIALPDFRGRVVAGKDDMVLGAASRLTGGSSGITATTLGAAGGDERMQQHTHGITDPGHFHAMLTRGDVNTSGGSGAFAAGASNLGGTSQTATTGISVNNAAQAAVRTSSRHWF